jgi:hypothetical protein
VAFVVVSRVGLYQSLFGSMGDFSTLLGDGRDLLSALWAVFAESLDDEPRADQTILKRVFWAVQV